MHFITEKYFLVSLTVCALGHMQYLTNILFPFRYSVTLEPYGLLKKHNLSVESEVTELYMG